MRFLRPALLTGLAFTIATANAGDLTFQDLTGKSHPTKTPEGTKATVYLYVSVDCPIANFYQPTLRRLAGRFEDKGVRFFQIHPDSELDPAAARKHAREFEVTVPIAIDAGQKLTRLHQATVTPQAIVVTADGTIAYRGRIDDTYTTYGKRRPEPTRRDLLEALTSILAGEKVKTPETKAVGCQIFIEKE